MAKKTEQEAGYKAMVPQPGYLMVPQPGYLVATGKCFCCGATIISIAQGSGLMPCAVYVAANAPRIENQSWGYG